MIVPMGALSPSLSDHFDRPRNVGRVEGATARGVAENPACGDRVEIEVREHVGVIEQARFMAHGCSSVVAVASLAVERIEGSTLAAARSLDLGALVQGAGGLPDNRRHAVLVVERALANALGGASA